MRYHNVSGGGVPSCSKEVILSIVPMLIIFVSSSGSSSSLSISFTHLSSQGVFLQLEQIVRVE